jgi:TonB-dependent receptor
LLHTNKAKVKTKLIFKTLGLLIFISLTANVIFAQSGKVAGQVSDKKTGETLIGLTVKIEGQPGGVSTDVDGRYIFNALTPGKYSFNFSFVGYQPKRITDVQVEAGKVTTLDVIMDAASSQQLKEVVVTASYKQATLGALYAQQKNRAGVSDGISSESIKKSPDRNTGEVLKRVSGTTIQDNKFVVVRGLSDRYNTAMLDNATLPSTEPNRKAFSFDIVPSNLVDNIVVSKTATPDLPGDFAGGAVQITTNDIPTQNFTTIGAGWGYNSQSTFKDYYFGQRQASDFVGFASAKRQLPIGFPASTDQTLSLSQPKSIAVIKAMPANWNIYGGTAAPSQNYQIAIGRVKNLEKNDGKIGAVLSLTYRNSQNSIGDQNRDYWEYNYRDNVNTFSSSIGALANFGYTAGKNKFTFKNIYNRILDDKFTFRTGLNNSSSSEVKYYAFDLLQKSLFKSTLEGEHKLGEKNSKINWNVAYSNVMNDQPDQRKVSYSRLKDTDGPFVANNTTVGKENNRLFSSLSEDIFSGAVNYSTPLTILKQSTNLKFGLGSQYRQRDFKARLLGMVLNNNYANYEEVRTLPITSLYDESLVDNGAYRLDEISNNSDKYNANSITSFAYAMLDNRIGEKVRVVWGLRAESFNLNLNSATVTNTPLKVKQHYLNLLPSVNFTYSASPKSNFRISYYRTLARPEFRELAPFSYYDYEQLGTVSGNANLKTTNIDNADLRYEIFPSAGQIFSVSVFYKRFQNAIEPSIYDVNSTPDFSYFNTPEATSYGAELEVRKSLDFVNAKNTMLYTNLSMIRSKVTNPTDQVYLEKERSMVGQSPYVINAGIQQAFLKDKLNFNLLYNRVGERIVRAGGQRFSSIWEHSRNVLDFQAAYKILKSKGELKLSVSDILNNQYLFYFDNAQTKQYKSSVDEISSRYNVGRNTSLSFSYSF